MFNAIPRSSVSFARSVLVSKASCQHADRVFPRALLRTNHLRTLTFPIRDFSYSPAQRQRAAQAVAVDEFLDDLIEENVHAQRPQSASQAQSATHTGLITKFQELADRGMVSKVVIDTITRQMGLETMTEVQSMTINKMLKGADT